MITEAILLGLNSVSLRLMIKFIDINMIKVLKSTEIDKSEIYIIKTTNVWFKRECDEKKVCQCIVDEKIMINTSK